MRAMELIGVKFDGSIYKDVDPIRYLWNIIWWNGIDLFEYGL